MNVKLQVFFCHTYTASYCLLTKTAKPLSWYICVFNYIDFNKDIYNTKRANNRAKTLKEAKIHAINIDLYPITAV